MQMAYFDNSATTKVCEKSAQKALYLMTENFGNPSSVHSLGIDAESEIENARKIIAKKLSCNSSEITFTSCGTEANNLAIFGGAFARKRMGNKIVTTAVEHPSVLNAVKHLETQGFEVAYLPVDKSGCVLEKDIYNAIDDRTILVSIMLVNNESGAIMPVKSARDAIDKKNSPALLHCDCVQGFGKVDFTPASLGADLISVSGHKIHAPKGIGALYVKKGVKLNPQIHGGGQEKGLRSGTEAVELIGAFGEAVRELPSVKIAEEKIGKINAFLREEIGKIDNFFINSGENASPYILNISTEKIPSEVMIRFLEIKGIFVSGGSACSKGARSHVLLAQGIGPKRIDCAIRISMCFENTMEEAKLLVDALKEGINLV